MIDRREEADKLEDTDMRNIFDHIFQSSFGNPIAFDSAPSLSEMKSDTWAFYGNDIYIKTKSGTGIKLSGTAMT